MRSSVFEGCLERFFVSRIWLFTLLPAIAAILLAANALADNGIQRVRRHQPHMSYLDNGVIRLGVDLNVGGTITYLSRSGTEQNLVNSYDFGRQIQMSYYSGGVSSVGILFKSATPLATPRNCWSTTTTRSSST
jgi:hypothetical protein